MIKGISFGSFCANLLASSFEIQTLVDFPRLFVTVNKRHSFLNFAMENLSEMTLKTLPVGKSCQERSRLGQMHNFCNMLRNAI